ncbi:MAG: hypothetical protein QXW65_02475 [Candidatus Pacearchaeota archaeon]
MKQKKAQVTIEFVLLVSAVVLLITMMIASTNFNTVLARAKNEQEALDDFANFLQQELILASEMHPVYERTIRLPEKIVGKSYSITIEDYLLIVNTSKFSVSRGIPFIDRNCRTFNYGDNVINKTHSDLKINC